MGLPNLLSLSACSQSNHLWLGSTSPKSPEYAIAVDFARVCDSVGIHGNDGRWCGIMQAGNEGAGREQSWLEHSPPL